MYIKMKSFIILLLIAFLPVVSSAQGAGGQVRRPVKKQQTTNTTPAKKRQSQKKESEQKPAKKQREKKPVEQNPSETSSETIIQRLINNMVYVEGGTFTMGATTSRYKDEKPAHRVTLSSFLIGKYEVTQEEWEAVMGDNSSRFKGAKRPMESITWNKCQEFIRKLNAMTGKQFRLPTEAEWEYAARGGRKSRNYKYSGSNILDDVGWYDGNSSNSTHDVGQLDPNELGLYDMSGNVAEWCADFYGSYESSAQGNPLGLSSESSRVHRGGNWDYWADCCRVLARSYNGPYMYADHIGLRLAL